MLFKRRSEELRARLFLLHIVILITTGLLSLAGCALASKTDGAALDGAQGLREVAVGEDFKIETKEKVSVKGTPLTIELKGVKLSWYANGKGEYPEADVVVALNGKEQRQWMKLGETIKSGEYVVKLTGAYPFGKTNAELIVTRG